MRTAFTVGLDVFASFGSTVLLHTRARCFATLAQKRILETYLHKLHYFSG
jgi:hypothetical protein